jgi:octaprenyl-diphosphate synthase
MSTITIDQIKAPIADDLDSFEAFFKKSMKSKVALLDRITYYIVKRKGKQLRPMFVFLSARLFGEVNPKTYRAASLVELLHTATLVHDDVVDDSFERRGFFSINALWKNKIAVLVGDYLLSRGLLIALDDGDYDLLQITSNAVKAMSEGELLQMEKARRLDIEESVYFDIIRQKTASLIAAACASGAVSVEADQEMIDRIRECGEKIGIAFQIKDDLFDYGDSNIGKPRGIDIREKKMTLPLIYTLEKVDRKTRAQIINTIKRHNKDKKKVNALIDTVRENGGIDYARETMEDYKQQALDILKELPQNEARDSLNDLIHFVTERTK